MFTIISVSILIGLIFAPLGCLVLWKRYVYFGDGLAHASMLAGIVSVMAGIPIFYAGILSTCIFAFTIFKLKNNSGNNAAIGLTASMMIATSLVLSYSSAGQINITKYLVGDIITASNQDITTLFCILTIVTLFFVLSYKDLILIILSKDVAGARGVKVKYLDLAFLAILSFSVLSTIKIVGALLVTSIILIPAMTARIIAKSPLSMIGFAVFFALLMNFFGIILSFYADIPFAPVIILCGGVMYVGVLCASYCMSKLVNRA
jgi:zinc transport system permease protein